MNLLMLFQKPFSLIICKIYLIERNIGYIIPIVDLKE